MTDKISVAPSPFSNTPTAVKPRGNATSTASKILQGAQAENDRLRTQNEKLQAKQTYLIGAGIVAAVTAATAGYFYGNPVAFTAAVDYMKGIPLAMTNLFASTVVDPVAKAKTAYDAAEAAVVNCKANAQCIATATTAAIAAKQVFDDISAAKTTLDEAVKTLADCVDQTTCKDAANLTVTAAKLAFDTLAAKI